MGEQAVLNVRLVGKLVSPTPQMARTLMEYSVFGVRNIRLTFVSDSMVSVYPMMPGVIVPIQAVSLPAGVKVMFAVVEPKLCSVIAEGLGQVITGRVNA